MLAADVFRRWLFCLSCSREHGHAFGCMLLSRSSQYTCSLNRTLVENHILGRAKTTLKELATNESRLVSVVEIKCDYFVGRALPENGGPNLSPVFPTTRTQTSTVEIKHALRRMIGPTAAQNGYFNLLLLTLARHYATTPLGLYFGLLPRHVAEHANRCDSTSWSFASCTYWIIFVVDARAWQWNLCSCWRQCATVC